MDIQFQMRKFTYLIGFLLVNGYFSYAQSSVTEIRIDSTGSKSFLIAERLFQAKKYKEAIPYYEQARTLRYSDSTGILLKISKAYSHLENPKESAAFLEEYLKREFGLEVFNDKDFAMISHSREFNGLKEKYLPRMTLKAVIFLFIAFLSFFLALMLLLKKTKSSNKGIIIVFLILHAIFLLQGVMMLTNLRFQFPHIFLASASFSYLYGPLIYLYFKKTTQKSPFEKWESLHFIPFITYLLYRSPVYLSSAEEKLYMILNYRQIKIHDFLIMTKIASLVLYAVLVAHIFKGNMELFKKHGYSGKASWQKAFISLFLIYVCTYLFYIAAVTFKWVSPVILVNIFLVTTSFLVLMVGYFTYVQPEVFQQGISLKNAILRKYKKSGLTQHYSSELKEELEGLMHRDYLYRDSTMNLEKLSETLGTTKHNTSQVINEHFNKNFFEFINQYRVEEAKKMLLETVDGKWKWDILDILIHTGFNNRITFNKVFKKITSSTPSDFRQAQESKIGLS